MPLGVPLTFLFQPWWAGDSCGAKVTLKSCAEPRMAPHASLQTAERSPTSSGGRVTCGGQGELGSCGCPKSANSLQLSAWRFYATPRAALEAWIYRALLAIISHCPQMQRYFQLAPPPPQLARCRRQGRKHLQRWAPRWYFNLSKPDEESSPGQSRSLEKRTVFPPEPGPGQRAQHFVKLIAYWAGSGVESSCRWCVFSVSACSRERSGCFFAWSASWTWGAFDLGWAHRVVFFGDAVAAINDFCYDPDCSISS